MMAEIHNPKKSMPEALKDEQFGLWLNKQEGCQALLKMILCLSEE